MNTRKAARSDGGFFPRGRGPGAPGWLLKLARVALFSAAVLGGLAGVGVLWLHLVGDPLADVRAYYDAARRLNEGAPLYPPGADTNAAEFYRYPPLLAIVLRPFALLPYPTFALLWEIGIVAALVATLRRVGLGSRTWLALGLLGIPLGWAVAVGQAHVLVMFLLAVGTPFSIAVAAHLKVFPLLAALYWVGRGEAAHVAVFLAWLVGLSVGQAFLEPAGWDAFWRVASLEQVGAVRNLSPYAASPSLWLGLLALGVVAALVLARTRFGWPAAVALATLAPPRLLEYMLSSLLAALRPPRPDPAAVAEAVPDAAEAYVRSAR